MLTLCNLNIIRKNTLIVSFFSSWKHGNFKISYMKSNMMRDLVLNLIFNFKTQSFNLCKLVLIFKQCPLSSLLKGKQNT